MKPGMVTRDPLVKCCRCSPSYSCALAFSLSYYPNLPEPSYLAQGRSVLVVATTRSVAVYI